MIKSVINNGKPSKKEKYPYLGVTEQGKVILFTAEKTGVVVVPRSGHEPQPVGHFSEIWGEDNFTPLKGSITLSNE